MSPGFDGTGPMGQGPMTGRAMGFCNGFNAPGYANPGFGRGMGFRRGFGFRRMAPATPVYRAPVYPQQPQLTKEQETQMLEQETKAIEEEQKLLNKELEDIKKRIEELKSKQ